MNQQIIYIIQSAGPAILMAVLLVVAGLIGYLTTWFYAKSVFKPEIKILEDEKAALNKKVSELNSEVEKLNGSVDTLNKEVDGLKKDKATLEKKIKGLGKDKK